MNIKLLERLKDLEGMVYDALDEIYIDELLCDIYNCLKEVIKEEEKPSR